VVSGGFMKDEGKIDLRFCGFEEEEDGRVCFSRREKRSAGSMLPFSIFKALDAPLDSVYPKQ